jgi:hypoxanthine phosphoribosyltransferase
MPSTEDNQPQSQPLHPDYLRVTWDEVQHKVNNLFGQMEASAYACTDILAVSRGGLVPARLLAAQFEKKGLNIPIHFIWASSYIGEEQRKEEITLEWMATKTVDDLNKRSTLVVDDLWDTGNTFKAIKENLPLAAFCALLSKNAESAWWLDFCAWTAAPSIKKWVVFPWEEPYLPKNPQRLENDFYTKAMKKELEGITPEMALIASDMWKRGDPLSIIHYYLRTKFSCPNLKKEAVREAIFQQ